MDKKIPPRAEAAFQEISCQFKNHVHWMQQIQLSASRFSCFGTTPDLISVNLIELGDLCLWLREAL
jgi:hypothetical protein